jgi:hypothetical protein
MGGPPKSVTVRRFSPSDSESGIENCATVALRPRPRAARERLAKSSVNARTAPSFQVELGFNPLDSGDGVFLIS